MITFNPLWETLKTKNMKKGDLQELTGLSSATVAKLSKDGSVTLLVVDRICKVLSVPIDKVVEIYDNAEEQGKLHKKIKKGPAIYEVKQ